MVRVVELRRRACSVPYTILKYNIDVKCLQLIIRFTLLSYVRGLVQAPTILKYNIKCLQLVIHNNTVLSVTLVHQTVNSWNAVNEYRLDPTGPQPTNSQNASVVNKRLLTFEDWGRGMGAWFP